MIKKGLKVKVISGKDKNKDGEVIEIDRPNNRVKVKDNHALKTSHLNNLESLDFENEQNLQIDELEKNNDMISLEDNQINSDQKIKTNELDKKEFVIKDKEKNTDIKILENKKSKSNFI